MNATCALFLLRAYSKLSDVTIRTISTIGELIHVMIGVFVPKIYYMFRNVTGGYHIEEYIPWATGSARPEWVFHSGNSTWYPWTGHIHDTLNSPTFHTHPLPILSLEIVDGERAHYDLTDFLEPMRIGQLGDVLLQTPSVAHLVSAWSISSRVVVDRERFRARIIDSEGNTVETILNDWRDLREVLEGGAEEGAEEAEEAEETGGAEGEADTRPAA
jgi:hypothetical protein